mmetsp:Transcript_7455/g.12604  ORF Transcript_7455/g.12604 Transcript_7455/m.12604 type:complete len:230 (-) Transcript_7455:35-724(-)
MRRSESTQESVDHRIHVEFADFTSLEFFQLFEKYAVRNANSLGMNEQEMGYLVDYWTALQKGKGLDAFRESLKLAQNSKPTFKAIIGQLKEFFQMKDKLGLDISRVHLHPYGSFFMCYETSKWESAREAIIKSSMAVPQYCVDPTKKSEELDLSNFELDSIPEYIEHPLKVNKKVRLHDKSLTYNFDLTSSVHCYMQVFIKCKQVYKTAGMGDTISGTGFIYHAPKLQN